MARHRSFDEKEVLGRAMHAFRRHGYARISIRQLEEATGLTSGSLYNAYRDKEGLYRAALAHYVDSFVVARLDAHAGPDATLEDLEELFLALFRPPLTDGFGCMVSNAAMEFGASGSIAGESVTRALDLVDASLHAVLAREVGPEASRAAADRLALVYQGILLMARAGRADTRHAEAVREDFMRLREARQRFKAGQGRPGQDQPAKKENAMSRKFNPEGMPAPAFYSNGVEVVSPQRLVFVAGQVGIRPDGSVAEGIAEQAQVAIANLNAVLAAAGMDASNIVKSTIYLTDESLMEGFAAAAAPLLPSPPPATTLLYVKALISPALLVEIEAVAAA